MSDATVTTLPTGPRSTPPPTEGALQCDQCPRTFDRPQALGRHRSAMHGTKKPRIATKAAAPQRVKATKPEFVVVSDRQALGVLAAAYADICAADVTASIEAAGDLLDAIERHGWQLVERS